MLSQMMEIEETENGNIRKMVRAQFMKTNCRKRMWLFRHMQVSDIEEPCDLCEVDRQESQGTSLGSLAEKLVLFWNGRL